MILFFKDKIIRLSLISSLAINLATWILVYFFIPITVEPIILRYNIYVGINLIGPWYHIFNFPLIGLLVILLNFLLARLIYKKDLLPARFLVIVSALSQLILFSIGFFLILINR